MSPAQVVEHLKAVALGIQASCRLLKVGQLALEASGCPIEEEQAVAELLSEVEHRLGNAIDDIENLSKVSPR